MSGNGDLYSSAGVLSKRKEDWAGPFPPSPPFHPYVKQEAPCSSESLEELVKKCKFLGPTLRLSQNPVWETRGLALLTNAPALCVLGSHQSSESLCSLGADGPWAFALEFWLAWVLLKWARWWCGLYNYNLCNWRYCFNQAGKAILTKLRTKQTLDSNEEILLGIYLKPSFGTAGVLKSVIIVNT